VIRSYSRSAGPYIRSFELPSVPSWKSAETRPHSSSSSIGTSASHLQHQSTFIGVHHYLSSVGNTGTRTSNCLEIGRHESQGNAVSERLSIKNSSCGSLENLRCFSLGFRSVGNNGCFCATIRRKKGLGCKELWPRANAPKQYLVSTPVRIESQADPQDA
jgi:hypothetical protein